MTRTKKLSFFTNACSQVSIVFPYVVASPAYFAGTVQLGGLMQTASAFNSVQGALSFFVSATCIERSRNGARSSSVWMDLAWQWQRRRRRRIRRR